MENYKIITDENALREFIGFLPELEDGECYYYSLFARNKYNSTNVLKADKQQLKRGTSTKEFLFEKIKNLEIEVGGYKQNHIPVPQEALALYISPNPRSYEKATKIALKKLLDLVLEKYSGYNPHQEVLSAIQKSCGRKIFYDFDFDGVDFEDVRDELLNSINPECLNIIVTRGGFHLLVEFSKLGKEYKKNWYNNIVAIKGVDIRTKYDSDKDGNDNSEEDKGILPCVGCCQGGFVPKLIKL